FAAAVPPPLYRRRCTAAPLFQNLVKSRFHTPIFEVDGKKEKASKSPRDEEALIECENCRGRTVLKLVGNVIRKGIKLPLEWNRNKVPVGDNKDYFASYIGVVVRERVNINFTAWDEVPKVINEVYDYIAVRKISLLVFFSPI
ncbi:hypothetical protein SOVF_128430, partial [Spinacia oleracea]